MGFKRKKRFVDKDQPNLKRLRIAVKELGDETQNQQTWNRLHNMPGREETLQKVSIKSRKQKRKEVKQLKKARHIAANQRKPVRCHFKCVMAIIGIWR
jgi:hypothetical protein